MDQEIFSKIIEKNGLFPNNSRLPLLLYKQALKSIVPESVEALFEKNGWVNIWVDGIYDFHHFHSNTHEVLGISAGKCLLQMGGEGGFVFEVEKGDVILIPAGVAHKNQSSSKDFVCVGAYPYSIEYDMNLGDKPFKDEELIHAAALPKTDPVYGEEGPLLSHWIS